MVKELLYFNGLYGDLNAINDVDYIFSELIKTRSEIFDWVVRPHIHNKLYQIFCVEFGNVTFQGINLEKKMSGPFVILVPPMAIHGLLYSKDVKGRILTLSDSYVEAALGKESLILSNLNNPEFIENFEGEHIFKEILDLILHIDREIFSEKVEQQSMIRALLCQLFIKSYRLFNTNHEIKKQVNMYLKHFNNFQKMIKVNGKIKSITEIAENLQITPIHLNRICKEITNKPALQIVHEHAIQEAEKYLKHTSLTIAEIAYSLNFEYPNYFSKLFKKYRKLTPLQYRKGIKKTER
jgi:AraC family transcriptional activator of pobA